MLDVDAPADDAEATFAAAQAAEEAGDLETAERLYSRVMKLDPTEPTGVQSRQRVARKRSQPRSGSGL